MNVGFDQQASSNQFFYVGHLLVHKQLATAIKANGASSKCVTSECIKWAAWKQAPLCPVWHWHTTITITISRGSLSPLVLTFNCCPHTTARRCLYSSFAFHFLFSCSQIVESLSIVYCTVVSCWIVGLN